MKLKRHLHSPLETNHYFRISGNSILPWRSWQSYQWCKIVECIFIYYGQKKDVQHEL